MDPNLNRLLKWSIQHSQTQPQQGAPTDQNETTTTTTTTTTAASTTETTSVTAAPVDTTTNPPFTDSTADLPPRGPSLDPSALASILFNAPSDAEMMQRSMAAIKNKAEIPLDSRLVAWDNFEQLIENMDNANNMENLGLWAPLKEELGAEEGEERVFAAWCVGTSVQNNVKAQAMLIKHAVLPALTSLALADPNPAVRKKAVFALSSSVRNFQPGLDEVVRCLKEEGHEGLLEGDDSVKAGDMDRVDRLISKLREGTQTQTQTQTQGQGQGQ